jgi:vacuolar iron transporter family protein
VSAVYAVNGTFAEVESDMVARSHLEQHSIHRVGWLRASVLGANDGLVSSASLILGVLAAGVPANTVLASGVAGLVAGALSMAAGEYVSVSSQRDAEAANLEREKQELAADPAHELAELQAIYERRGVSPELAAQVATELTRHDALAAHARDELGITEALSARPLQAALASAAAFATGAVLPLLAALLAPGRWMILSVCLIAIAALIGLGCASAYLGSAPMAKSTARVTFWGIVAMALTAGAGYGFGAVLG